jgi:hypothetical protein
MVAQLLYTAPIHLVCVCLYEPGRYFKLQALDFIIAEKGGGDDDDDDDEGDDGGDEEEGDGEEDEEQAGGGWARGNGPYGW